MQNQDWPSVFNAVTAVVALVSLVLSLWSIWDRRKVRVSLRSAVVDHEQSQQPAGDWKRTCTLVLTVRNRSAFAITVDSAWALLPKNEALSGRISKAQGNRILSNDACEIVWGGDLAWDLVIRGARRLRVRLRTGEVYAVRWFRLQQMLCEVAYWHEKQMVPGFWQKMKWCFWPRTRLTSPPPA